MRITSYQAEKKIVKCLEDRYRLCSTEVKERLKDVPDIAITTDIWSSENQKSFISVTAHFIQYSKLQSIVISTTELLQNHTSLNIANTLNDILLDWQIRDKIVTVVTDNASSMKKSGQRFFKYEKSFLRGSYIKFSCEGLHW